MLFLVFEVKRLRASKTILVFDIGLMLIKAIVLIGLVVKINVFPQKMGVK